MRVSTIGKASAAFAALGTVAGPYAAVASAAPTHVSAAARPAGASLTPIIGQCSGPTDYRRQESVHLKNTRTGAISADTAELWYSPTSRCVYGKLVNGTGTCGTNGGVGGGFIRCEADVQQTDSSGGNAQQVASCVVDTGQQACVTPLIYDGGVMAATIGTKAESSTSQWFGKTAWW